MCIGPRRSSRRSGYHELPVQLGSQGLDPFAKVLGQFGQLGVLQHQHQELRGLLRSHHLALGGLGGERFPMLRIGIVVRFVAIGLPPRQIYIYERFLNQMNSVRYENEVPAGVNVWAAESERGSAAGYDPGVYVEANFFGEEDTRSSLVRLVSEKLTKIINLPNMKEHQAAGVTGCLKNIAYGHFSNVDRSHRSAKTNTYSFIGTLAAVEPIPSKTVLHIMDGLRGVWHAGPFSTDRKFRFFPKKMMFGTDPGARDRLLIDIIEEKRRQEKAPSIFDRSKERLVTGRSQDANVNQFIREPGHIEYAAGLGLGIYDIEQIRVLSIEL